MQSNTANLFTRDDTFFGVCEGLGQDLRVPANLLRLSFAGLLFYSPVGAIGLYFGLGALVLASRLLFPARARKAAAVQAPVVAPAVSAAEHAPVIEEERELLAA